MIGKVAEKDRGVEKANYLDGVAQLVERRSLTDELSLACTGHAETRPTFYH